MDDASQVGALLDQTEQDIDQITADGAYDTETTYQTIAQRDSSIDVVIPPRLTAQPSLRFENSLSKRDTHLLLIQSLGRLDCRRQRATANAHWYRLPGADTNPLLDQSCGRVTSVVSRRQRPLRWQCSTACGLPNARTPFALLQWLHKPVSGRGYLERICLRATTPLYTEGFSHFITSIAAPITSDWSKIAPGGICTHWKSAAFS